MTCAISDTGTGIAADDLPHVFDPARQGERRGAGIGLAIASQTVTEQ